MFTPEDDMDALDEDLGRLRRTLHQLDQTPPHRITDDTEWLRRRQLVVDEIATLEHERALRVAGLIAEAEGFRS